MPTPALARPHPTRPADQATYRIPRLRPRHSHPVTKTTPSHSHLISSHHHHPITHPFSPHSLTPHTPRPALTPSHSPYSPVARCGTQPTLPTSYSHCQLATGLRTLSPLPAPAPPTPAAPPLPAPAAPAEPGTVPFGAAAPPPATPPAELMRSQTKTWQSSAPEASVPRRSGDHSTQLRAPEWPRSSRRACPGWRTSRMRMTLESCAKVARRWWSCGEVARRRSGGGCERVCCARVGLRRPPLASGFVVREKTRV